MLIALVTVLTLLKYSIEHIRGRGSSKNSHKTRSSNSSSDIDSNMSSYTAPTQQQQQSQSQQQQQQQHVQTSAAVSVAVAAASAAEETDNINGTGSGGAGTGVIVFRAGDKQCCHEIVDKHVKIVGSAGTHDHGSSKVKLKNIVDYKWEIKNYPGHLIAVHIDGEHVAYVINVNNKVSRVEGMVRVVNAQSGLRALIKGMSGEVLDLQFAHIEKLRMLASIDMNSLYVHNITMHEGNLLCSLVIKVEDPLAGYTPKYDKISWCPFIDVPGEDDEDSQLIVWARGSMLQCFNVNVIVAEHGKGLVHPHSLNGGYLKVYDDMLTISWAALSPDGSTLGVGSTDGVIRFYQVYMHDADPRCLHHWKPHNGKPISSFFFLDNLTKNVSDTYWKYAITGASNNTEFKVWDCGTWECLQTLNITNANDEKKPLRFIAEIDRTSSYMVLSSLETRTCYILQIVNNNNNNSSNVSAVKDSDSESNNARDTSSSSIGSTTSAKAPVKNSTPAPQVFIKSISEFPLNSGILSFSIVDAAVRRYKCGNDNYLCEEFDDYDEETNSTYCVVVRMFIVQSKSMQECRILYQPTVTENTDVRSTISLESAGAPGSKDSSLLDAVAGLSGSKEGHLNSKYSNSNSGVEKAEVKLEESGSGGDIPKLSKDTLTQQMLEVFYASKGYAPNQITLQTTTTNSSVVAVAAAASSVTPVVVAEINDARSRTASPGGKNYAQVNLMTPDAFSSTSSEKKTPDCVSSEVLNTILMLASVAGQAAPVAKQDNMNILNQLVNNKVIEDQEHQKLQMKQNLNSQKKFIAIDNNMTRSMGDNLASGGSSPSREVQEIMSLQDYDKSSYSGDELPEEATVKTVSEVPVETSAADAPSETGSTNWPKVPDVHKVNTKHSAELQNAANLISQAVDASSSSGNLSNSHLPPAIISSAGVLNNSGDSAANSVGSGASELSEINMKMSQLIELVKVQSMQINGLQTEIASMKKANPMASSKSMSEFSFKLEMQLSKLMEQYLKRYENEHKKKLAAFMLGREAQNRELCDSIMHIVNQYLLTQMGEIVSKVIAIEIQRQIGPVLASKIDHLQQQIQLDVAQKLTAFDLMLKENIAQVCKSKNIIDAFGKSVLIGVQDSLQAAFIESMSSTLIPAYEKSSQNMFKQLHEAFSVGIKEFMEQFDNYLRHLQPMQDSTEEILNKFSGFRQHLDNILTKNRSVVTEAILETRKDVKGMEVLFTHQIQETIRAEMRKCFENQTVALRSQANTPAPMYDLRDSIKLLLHQGQINKAFHQALLANDLHLVEFTLRNADHTAVFTPDCCLEQKVLLSLIQQISADMSNHNEVKQNYLAEALLAINPLDPITREHAPKVLQELYRNCQMFLANYPKSPQCSNVRMLMKAVQAYKDQF